MQKDQSAKSIRGACEVPPAALALALSFTHNSAVPVRAEGLPCSRFVEARAKGHYHQTQTSDLDDETKKILLDVYVNWLQQRLETKDLKEIEMLLVEDLHE